MNKFWDIKRKKYLFRWDLGKKYCFHSPEKHLNSLVQWFPTGVPWKGAKGATRYWIMSGFFFQCFTTWGTSDRHFWHVGVPPIFLYLKAGGGNIRPATSSPRRLIFFSLTLPFWLKCGPRDTNKEAMWLADENSCPPMP